MAEVKVLTQFSEFPGPRYCKQGSYSGEAFYHKVLNEAFADALENHEKLILDLDGTDGYMSSFIDEAVGNLVFDFGVELVKDNLIVISKEEKIWIDLVKQKVIPEWGENKENGIFPKKTFKKDHPAWYRLVAGKLEKKVWIQST